MKPSNDNSKIKLRKKTWQHGKHELSGLSLKTKNIHWLNCLLIRHLSLVWSDQRSTVESELGEEMDWLNQMKEKLAKLDDISGADEDILSRLQKTKVRKC